MWPFRKNKKFVRISGKIVDKKLVDDNRCSHIVYTLAFTGGNLLIKTTVDIGNVEEFVTCVIKK